MNTNNILVIYDGERFDVFLKELRTYLSLTQQELSDRMKNVADGLSHSSIRSYEQGKSLPKYPYDLIDELKEEFKYELITRGIDIVIRTNKYMV